MRKKKTLPTYADIRQKIVIKPCFVKWKTIYHNGFSFANILLLGRELKKLHKRCKRSKDKC